MKIFKVIKKIISLALMNKIIKLLKELAANDATIAITVMAVTKSEQLIL